MVWYGKSLIFFGVDHIGILRIYCKFSGKKLMGESDSSRNDSYVGHYLLQSTNLTSSLCYSLSSSWICCSLLILLYFAIFWIGETYLQNTLLCYSTHCFAFLRILALRVILENKDNVVSWYSALQNASFLFLKKLGDFSFSKSMLSKEGRSALEAFRQSKPPPSAMLGIPVPQVIPFDNLPQRLLFMLISMFSSESKTTWFHITYCYEEH